MRRCIVTGFWLVVVICAIQYGAGARDTGIVLRVQDSRLISPARMMEEVRTVNIVFIGEIHDEVGHHRDELEIIRAFHNAEVPIALGLEMFRAGDQSLLDSWTAGTLAPDTFIRAYYDSWRLPWSLYQDIFWYARDHRIPLVGLNIPDGITEKISRKGFSSLSAKEREQLPAGISCNVDQHYQDFIRRAYRGHTHRDLDFTNFCEAQMVWDKSMARHLISYLDKNPNRTVVVLAGVGHAWKRGIPERITEDSRYSVRVIMPLVPEQIELGGVTTEDTDYVLLR